MPNDKAQTTNFLPVDEIPDDCYVILHYAPRSPEPKWYCEIDGMKNKEFRGATAADALRFAINERAKHVA